MIERNCSTCKHQLKTTRTGPQISLHCHVEGDNDPCSTKNNLKSWEPFQMSEGANVRKWVEAMFGSNKVGDITQGDMSDDNQSRHTKV